METPLTIITANERYCQVEVVADTKTSKNAVAQTARMCDEYIPFMLLARFLLTFLLTNCLALDDTRWYKKARNKVRDSNRTVLYVTRWH